jgi:phosphatidate phosphatase LPIN
MLAGTKEKGVMAVSTFKADVHKNLEKHTNPAPRPKIRFTSGTSEKSDVSFDSGTDFYTSLNNGRQTRYKRTLRLESSQLKNLNLQHGMNEARFSISTKFQGTSWCACHIYLLKYNEKIVISDIDGTITKSDVLGHIIPAIGGTWAHTNIVDLYTRIQNNG